MCYTHKFKSIMSCLFYCSVAVLYDIHCYFSVINVTCDDVSGSVGKEVRLTCKVSLQNTDCYFIIYTFRNPNNSMICKEEFPKELREQRNNTVTCSYTPTTAMTERFRFFVQTTCEQKTTEFTVNIAGTVHNTVVYN